MKTERRAKVQAIADDPRGDPTVRERAREWLAKHPAPIAPRGVVPGVTPSPEYVAWKKAQHIPKRS